VFGYWVRDPERYGVAEFDGSGKVIGLEEKPTQPKSNYAVTGLYFYDGRASDFAAALKPSPRGELEITDLNRCYLDDGSCSWRNWVAAMPGSTPAPTSRWSRPRTFIETIEKRQGLRVSCPEEIAYFNGWIDDDQLRARRPLAKNGYGQYLLGLLEHGRVR
jgi:glucose-1-phosphate thymidylyltransferase